MPYETPNFPHKPYQDHGLQTVPFSHVEEVWFWFIQANQARLDGARHTSNQGNIKRPCEPVDIYKIVDRLYRNRRLLIDHIRVLRYYGVRMTPPEAWRPREARAATLWGEAMRVLEPILKSKKILRGDFDDKTVVPIWAHRDAARHSSQWRGI